MPSRRIAMSMPDWLSSSSPGKPRPQARGFPDASAQQIEAARVPRARSRAAKHGPVAAPGSARHRRIENTPSPQGPADADRQAIDSSESPPPPPTIRATSVACGAGPRIGHRRPALGAHSPGCQSASPMQSVVSPFARPHSLSVPLFRVGIGSFRGRLEPESQSLRRYEPDHVF